MKWWHNTQCHQYHLMPMPLPMVPHDQKVMLHLILVVMTSRMQWYHWQYFLHYIILIPMEMASHDTNVIGIMSFWYQLCHMTKMAMLHCISTVLTQRIQRCHWWSIGIMWHWWNACGLKWPQNHVAPHLDFFDLSNAVVPLTKLLAPHAASAGANGVTYQKSHVSHHFDHLYLGNAMVSLMMLSASHDADNNAVALHDTNTNVSNIMWCQCWCH